MITYSCFFVGPIDDDEEPSCFKEIQRFKALAEAMDEETVRNETWDVVPKPKEVYSVSCKWVYKIFYLKKK